MKRGRPLRRGKPLERRTELKRGKPLERRARLTTTTRLRPRAPKQAARQREWNEITREKLERGESCVDARVSRCAGRIDGDHLVPTGRGGPWTEDNHRLRCRKHHDRKHGKPWAEETAGAWGTHPEDEVAA